jgi:tRNA threonylcarbamoyladenosine biosynthesis protein TsaB
LEVRSLWFTPFEWCLVRILALETTEMIGGVAAMCDRNLLAELELSPQQRSAQSLVPGIRSLLGQVGWQPADVDLVAVSSGPGSFTGLRVGVTTAKALAYAVGADILGVDTLQTIAVGAPSDVRVLSVAIDAHRGEVVTQSFARDRDDWLQPAGAARLLAAETWLGGLAAGTVITGPVLRKLAGRVPDPQYWPPKAAAVARLAERLYAAGRRDDLWGLVPRYFRRSAAEEKWQVPRRENS